MIAAALVANGTRVYIVGRKAGALEQAATELSADGGICIPIIGDLSLPDEPARIAALLREREEGIDFLINKDRKSVVWGKSVSDRVNYGGRRVIKKKKISKT